MRDNAFGTFVKVLAALWTAACVYGCFASLGETSVFEPASESSDTVVGFTVIAAWTMWGTIWLFPSIGALVLYFLFGRSPIPPAPSAAPPPRAARAEDPQEEKRDEPASLKTWIERAAAIAILALLVLGSVLGWWR